MHPAIHLPGSFAEYVRLGRNVACGESSDPMSTKKELMQSRSAPVAETKAQQRKRERLEARKKRKETKTGSDQGSGIPREKLEEAMELEKKLNDERIAQEKTAAAVLAKKVAEDLKPRATEVRTVWRSTSEWTVDKLSPADRAILSKVCCSKNVW